MKTLPSFRALAAIIALTLAHAAHAAPLTLQVDMSVQTALGAFDPAADTVLASGTFNGWATDFVLAPTAENPAVYSGTIDDTANPAGSTVQYKFIINRAGTMNWESINNRTLPLPATATTVPVAFFNDLASLGDGVEITFRVNMSVQTELGRFDPAADMVVVAGTFNAWSTADLILTNSATEPAIYSGSYTDINAPGSAVEFKFVISGAATGLNWEGINNRQFTLPAASTALPVVFFNNLTNNPGSGIPVTFEVNLGVQAALGLFDPNFDTVVVAGTFNNWSATASPLTNSVEQPNVFRGTFNNATDAPGSTAQHKFVINGANWESIANRAITLASAAQTLDPVFFNDVSSIGALTLTNSAGGELTISWTAGAAIRLQSAPSVTGPWQDVPDSLAQAEMILPMAASGARFFRLAAGP